MEDVDFETLMKLYKNLPSAPSSSYYTIIEEEIPEMENGYDFIDVEDSIKQSSTLSSNYRNHSSVENLDISRKLEHVDVVVSAPSYLTSCDLSSSDCIKKSILYTNIPRRMFYEPKNLKFGFAELPLIYSASTSSEANSPFDEELINDSSYPIIEELPSDGEKAYSASDEPVSTDDERNESRLTLKPYSDSFDEIESPRHAIQNTKNVYQYFQNCLEASQRLKQSIESPKYDDVIDKVINNYQSLSSRKISLCDDSSSNSSTNSRWSLRTSGQANSWSGESSIDYANQCTQSSRSSQQFSSLSLSSPRPNSEINIELSNSFCQKFNDLILTEPLCEIILEPPDMFKSNDQNIELNFWQIKPKTQDLDEDESIFKQYDVHLSPAKNFTSRNCRQDDDDDDDEDEMKIENVYVMPLFYKDAGTDFSRSSGEFENAERIEKHCSFWQNASINTSTEFESLPKDVASENANFSDDESAETMYSEKINGIVGQTDECTETEESRHLDFLIDLVCRDGNRIEIGELSEKNRDEVIVDDELPITQFTCSNLIQKKPLIDVLPVREVVAVNDEILSTMEPFNNFGYSFTVEDESPESLQHDEITMKNHAPVTLSHDDAFADNVIEETVTSFRFADTLAEDTSPCENVKVAFSFDEKNNSVDDFFTQSTIPEDVVPFPTLYNENVISITKPPTLTALSGTEFSNGWVPWKPNSNTAEHTSVESTASLKCHPTESKLFLSHVDECSSEEQSVRKSCEPVTSSSLQPIIPVVFRECKMKLFNLAEHVRQYSRCDELFEFALRRSSLLTDMKLNDCNNGTSRISRYFDDMPNPSLLREYDEEGGTTLYSKRWLTEALTVNDDRARIQQHATDGSALISLAAARRNSGPAFNLAECWSWKISNGTPSHLRKWRRSFPTSMVAETMRSLNSSKLDLTGCVTPELCVVKARADCGTSTCDYIFAAPLDKRRFSVVRDLIFGAAHSELQQQSPCVRDDENNLRISNIEAIREFSDYFEQSLETDSKLREGIPDLSLDNDLGECGRGDENENEDVRDHEQSQQAVTSFVYSSSSSESTGSSPSPVVLFDGGEEESLHAAMKNKKKSAAAVVEDTCTAESEEPAARSGILKSALKRSSKKFHKKKHRVQFDESLNKFFEADYVILVRDDEYEDDYGRCECGNQFCYEGCYYEEEDEEDEYEQPISVDSPRYDFAAAFDPPIDFVDPVTLSPPDGYKDGCCPQLAAYKVSTATMTSANNEDCNTKGGRIENQERLRKDDVTTKTAATVATAYGEKSKNQDYIIDDNGSARKNFRAQGYPFHANDVNASSQLAVFNNENVSTNGPSRYIVETITMTTVTEHRIVHESSNDQMKMADCMLPEKYNNGILKGGKLWRSNSQENEAAAPSKTNFHSEDVTPASENSTLSSASKMNIDDKRSVKFMQGNFTEDDNCDRNENQEKGAFTLTFKLGNRVVPCNSLKPNSAVRQLFPDPRFVNPPTASSEVDCDENLGKCEGKYLITEESLRAFNEVNRRSVFATFKGKERYPYKDGNFPIHSDDEDISQNDLIKKTIERNTLRRSLMRYPKGQKGAQKKCEVSLEERIKQLCVDDEVTSESCDPVCSTGLRTSPPGEEAPTNENSVSSNKKFTNPFHRVETQPAIDQHYPYYEPVYHAAQPDLGIGTQHQLIPAAKKPSGATEARKQFLSSLAPLTACVSGQSEPAYSIRESLKLKLPSDRHSIVSNSSTGTEYSLGDIDEALCKPLAPDGHTPQPDAVANTPGADSNQDELAMFVQQDAGRIERIKKRWAFNGSSNAAVEDDEHDDYGFSRRPSVRGIKPRFGSTTEILQQIQAQLPPPLLTCPTKPGSHMTWPYYSAEISDDNKAAITSARNPALAAVKEENTAEYTTKVVWEKGTTLPPRVLQQPLKVDTSCNNVHMLRLTPTDPSLSEVTVPYKYDGNVTNARFPVANNIFQMKLSPASSGGQMRLPAVQVPDGQLSTHSLPMSATSVIRMGHGQQQTFRVPCPVSGPVQVHLLATHHYESPQIRSSQPLHFPSQIVVAKGTQTSSISTTSFYQLQTNSKNHYPMVGGCQAPVCQSNTTTTTEQAKLIQVNYTNAHPSPPIPSLTSSPTRLKSKNANLMERGIPEGAVSSSPAYLQDSARPPQSAITDATGTQQQNKSSGSSVMYGMKV